MNSLRSSPPYPKTRRAEHVPICPEYILYIHTPGVCIFILRIYIYVCVCITYLYKSWNGRPGGTVVRVRISLTGALFLATARLHS